MLRFSLPRLLAIASSVGALSLTLREDKNVSWPNSPFQTSGRWIIDASGGIATYAGINWPGHMEAMIPEGLQYRSISDIVSSIKSIGMNSIRLTYSIQMIDEIYEKGKDTPIHTSLINALGETNGTKVYNRIVSNNPSFDIGTSRLDVFDAVAAECAAQEIYVHLDNQMSSATWCCSTTDGNGWWADTYFNVTNWIRGISYMAAHAKPWPSFTSMSLRNEPRDPADNSILANDTYNWEDWYKYIKMGSSAINAANRDVLIFVAGLNFDTYLTPVVQGTNLGPGTGTWNPREFPANKVVLEIHNYANSASDCSSLKSSLFTDGFQALSNSATNVFPVVMTEWGFNMEGAAWQGVYTQCLAEYLPEKQAGWMLWVLGGSYYTREGIQDSDEAWGLLNHNWTTWRNPSYVMKSLAPMVNATISA